MLPRERRTKEIQRWQEVEENGGLNVDTSLMCYWGCFRVRYILDDLSWEVANSSEILSTRLECMHGWIEVLWCKAVRATQGSQSDFFLSGLQQKFFL